MRKYRLHQVMSLLLGFSDTQQSFDYRIALSICVVAPCVMYLLSGRQEYLEG